MRGFLLLFFFPLAVMGEPTEDTFFGEGSQRELHGSYKTNSGIYNVNDGMYNINMEKFTEQREAILDSMEESGALGE